MKLKHRTIRTLKENTDYLFTDSKYRWDVVNNIDISSIPIDIMKGAF